LALFPVPAHRTGLAVFPHDALPDPIRAEQSPSDQLNLFSQPVLYNIEGHTDDAVREVKGKGWSATLQAVELQRSEIWSVDEIALEHASGNLTARRQAEGGFVWKHCNLFSRSGV
jgi:hypothetical protein